MFFDVRLLKHAIQTVHRCQSAWKRHVAIPGRTLSRRAASGTSPRAHVHYGAGEPSAWRTRQALTRCGRSTGSKGGQTPQRGHNRNSESACTTQTRAAMTDGNAGMGRAHVRQQRVAGRRCVQQGRETAQNAKARANTQRSYWARGLPQ